jgi:hypothetical protein
VTPTEKEYRQHLGKLVYQLPRYSHFRRPDEQIEQLLFIDSMERLGGWWHYRLTPLGKQLSKGGLHTQCQLCKELHFSLTGQEYNQSHARYTYRLANEEKDEEAKQ